MRTSDDLKVTTVTEKEQAHNVGVQLGMTIVSITRGSTATRLHKVDDLIKAMRESYVEAGDSVTITFRGSSSTRRSTSASSSSTSAVAATPAATTAAAVFANTTTNTNATTLTTTANATTTTSDDDLKTPQRKEAVGRLVARYEPTDKKTNSTERNKSAWKSLLRAVERPQSSIELGNDRDDDDDCAHATPTIASEDRQKASWATSAPSVQPTNQNSREPRATSGITVRPCRAHPRHSRDRTPGNDDGFEPQQHPPVDERGRLCLSPHPRGFPRGGSGG